MPIFANAPPGEHENEDSAMTAAHVSDKADVDDMTAANDLNYDDSDDVDGPIIDDSTNQTVGSHLTAIYDQHAAKEQLTQSSFGAENDLQTYLQNLSQRGASLRPLNAVTHAQAKEMETLFAEFPNMREPITAIIGSLYLSASASREFSIPPMLIQGPPGCGKTELVRRLSILLEIPLATIAMGSINGNFELPGGHRGYRGATVGTLCKQLINSPVANPLYLFDEAELGSTELYQPLLQFLEDDEFKDHFLEIKFNTKHVNIIFVTNDKELLPAAIRSRLIEFDVGKPNDVETIAICQRIYQRMRMENSRYETFPEALDSHCLELLSRGPMREVRKNIELAFFRSAARAKEMGNFGITEADIPGQPKKRGIGFI